ncbi:MAG: fasciclin domain-containing protein [Bacteroidetes bacterium]|nr:fasciclin domain-containing protein [Bacteroidota bacterium]
MKKNILFTSIAVVVISFGMNSCGNKEENNTSDATASETPATNAPAGGGAASVQDDVSQPNIVKVAIGSKDHTTLVAAVQAAELVDVLAQSGPYTVFAPTNAAFDLLPKGTVDGLLKPEKKADLQNILQYHVTTSMYSESMFRDGLKLGMANGGSVVITKKDGKLMVNDANIVGHVSASNGIIYVIDKVLLPSQ